MDFALGARMRLSQVAARIAIPDGAPADEALSRTATLGIGAHPDDLEIMTWRGIAGGRAGAPFSGVVVTDGAASPRAGRSAVASDEELRALRLDEQRRAAAMGGYAALVTLGFASAAVKATRNAELVQDLSAVIAAARPREVHTHSPFDAHDTHVAVALHVVHALRALPAELRPGRVYGFEVWGGLDWLPAPDRVRFDVSEAAELGPALIRAHASQLAAKAYDVAALGRKRANATFGDARAPDDSTAVELAVDLTPLVRDPALAPDEWALGVVRRFGDEVAGRLRRLLG